MEKPKRARRRKLDTAKADLKLPNLQYSGGQGVHREVESEGHEEKYRAVIDGGCPEDEPVGQRWGKVECCLAVYLTGSFLRYFVREVGRSPG